MAVIPTPYPAGRTYLWYAGEMLRQLKDNIRQIASHIDGVFIIGDYLAAPFYDWAYFIGIASEYFFRSDDYIRSLKGWLDGLYDGWNFLNLINWASWHYREIRVNAVNWVKSRFAEAGYWHYWLAFSPQNFLNHFIIHVAYWLTEFIRNPEFTIQRLFRGFRFWIGQFLDDPLNWIISTIGRIMPTFHNFIVNPVNYILNLLRQRIVDFDLLITSPQNWVVRQLIKQIPEFMSFWQNPSHWLKTRIAQWFSLPPNFWYNPKLYLMDHIMDGLEIYLMRYIERIKKLLIDIILRFI